MEILSKMVEALIVTLREGIEIALIVGIVLAYLRRSGRSALNSSVYTGLGLGLAASIIGAILFQLFGFDPENELMEGIILLLAALLVGTLVIWMWRSARYIKREMEERLDRLVPDEGPTRRSSLALLFFTFVMVFREGIETVLFLMALSMDSGVSPIYNLTGGAVGISLAFVFGLLLIKGSIRIDLKRFFVVTGAVLMVLVMKLFISSLHEFAEVGVLPAVPWLLSLGEFVHHRPETQVFTLVALILLPALMILWENWRGVAAEEAARGPRRWAVAMGITAVALSFLLILSLMAPAGSHDGIEQKDTHELNLVK